MRLEIGLIGATRIAERAIIAPARERADVAVRAVAASDPLRAQEFACRNGIPVVHASYSDLVDDPSVDLVYISLHNSAHHPWTVLAARAGKHVLVEKPLCLSAAELEEISSVAAGVHVIEALPTAGHPWQERVRDLTRTIGPLRGMHTRTVFAPFVPGGYRSSPELGGGVFHDAAPYWLQAVQAVASLEHAVGRGRVVTTDGSVDTSFQASLSLAGDVDASFECSTGPRHVAEHRFTFTEGTARLRGFLLPVAGRVPLSLVVEGQSIHSFPAASYYETQLDRVVAQVSGSAVSWGGELTAAAERIRLMAAIRKEAR